MTYAKVLTALADPTRRQIFESLHAGELNVTALSEKVPVSRPAVSQHLKVLKGAGLVTERTSGRQNLYCIDSRGLNSLRNYLEQFWSGVFDSYQQALTKSLREKKRRKK